MSVFSGAPQNPPLGVTLGKLESRCSHPLEIALLTVDIAKTLGITACGEVSGRNRLVVDAPLTSLVCGTRSRFLRGWQEFESCIKGFNALGLMAEHCLAELSRLKKQSEVELRNARRSYLRSRKNSAGASVFPDTLPISDAEIDSLDVVSLALWCAFGTRTIVCSTSSNMGVSLHEALRYMQQKQISIAGKSFMLLNQDEGGLIIWCPDEQADFMNAEKTALLRGIEAEAPRLTQLHTYINRKQRDPGALKDALLLGGYFFPTNPQSGEEMQNLLTLSLNDIAKERNISFSAVLKDPNTSRALESLGVEIGADHVVVRHGVEGGLYGLMTPYLIMLEETLGRGDSESVSVWNQASIGAALAAAVLCDQLLSEPQALPSNILGQIEERFPRLAQALGQRRIGRGFQTRIHGVFDIANLQSLAQLFGVVIEHHLSGRGTAFVGLGSSSYSNGNRCYDILRENAQRHGAFRGKSALHPATHTLNPIAQALVFADDLYAAISDSNFASLSREERIAYVQSHARKPEPAGAASLAGYLLKRLDESTLSIVEIAFALRLVGFRRGTFLKFCRYEEETPNLSSFVQEASEEGARMATTATELLRYLDLPLELLHEEAARARSKHRIDYAWDPFDDDAFESTGPVLNLYLTGDNCLQPEHELISELVEKALANRAEAGELLRRDSETLEKLRACASIRMARQLRAVGQRGVRLLQQGIDWSFSRLLQPAVSRYVKNRLSAVPVSSSIVRAKPEVASVADKIRARFEESSMKPFLIDAGTGKETSYSDFYRLARKASGVLKAHGIKRGDRVLLALPNSVEFISLYFGAMFSGAAVVPINPTLSRAEVDFILTHSRAQLMVISTTTDHVIRDSKVKDLPRTIRISLNEGDGGTVAIEKGEEAEPFIGARNDDALSILFTSGTTGVPKAVVNRIEASFLNAELFNKRMGFGADCRILHNWPMSYSTGLLNCLVMPFVAGGTIVLHRPFDASSILDFWNPIIKHKVNSLWLSPTMLAALFKLDRDAQGLEYCAEVNPTICVGTAPLPIAVAANFERKYGVRLYESYGLSELLILSTNSPLDQCDPAGVGFALDGVQFRVVSDENKVLEQGEEGELEARTPCIMKGYLNYISSLPDDRTADDWFPTGDIGVISSDRRIRITGRKKDLIIRAGLNISPRTIEELLYTHARVQTAAVVGIPDEMAGEQIVACVECKTGADFEVIKGELVQLCKQELAASKIPQVFLEFSEFPMNRNGKIMKSVLRERVIERLVEKVVPAPSRQAQAAPHS